MGATLAVLLAVRYAHGVRIKSAYHLHMWLLAGFSRFWYAMRYARTKNHIRPTRTQNHTQKPHKNHKPKIDKSE